MRMPVVLRRWAYVGALVGAGVSIAANVLHSYVPPPGMPLTWRPATGAVIGAIFWPVALLIAIEIFARWHPVELRFKLLRWLGLVPVAVVAAVVSYRHMSGLLEFWHEDPVTVVIGPLAVDGIMTMAAGALASTSSTPPGSVAAPAAASPVASPAAPAASLSDVVARPRVDLAKRPKSQASPTRGVRVGRPAGRPALQLMPAADATDGMSVDAIRRARATEPRATQKRVADLAGVSVRTVARYWHATTPAVNGSTPHAT